MLNMRKGAAGLAAVAFVLPFAACSSGDDESVFNAEVGECLERISDITGQVDRIPETDCDEDHEGEIFFLFEHEGDDDDFPGTDALQEEASDDCIGDEFEDYTGVAYADTAIDVAFITPSEDSWSNGDRETICVLSVPNETVDESFEDNGEDFPLGGSNGGSDSGDSGDSGGQEAGDPDEPPDIDDSDLAALADDCFGGSGQACDELFFQAPPGSDAEEYGDTCGHRFDESPGLCSEAIGE